MKSDWNNTKERAKKQISFWLKEMTRLGANESVAECRRNAAEYSLIYTAAKAIADEERQAQLYDDTSRTPEPMKVEPCTFGGGHVQKTTPNVSQKASFGENNNE